MLPIVNVDSFAHRLKAIKADEYVTQYLKPTRSRFSAGSTAVALERMREDNWTPGHYEHAKTRIASVLAPESKLLEGAEGYAPAQ
jgi:hypothetical protein